MISIYCITNKVNGKLYIGQALNVRKRWNNHIHAANAGYKFRISKAIRKYGKENFIVEVLEECSLEDCSELERYYISLADSVRTGYNISFGGIGNSLRGTPLSEEHKRKIQAANKKRKPHENSVRALIEYQKKPKSEKFSGSRDRQREVHSKRVKDSSGRIYNSITEAARLLGIHKALISRVLNGGALTTGGLGFGYVK